MKYQVIRVQKRFEGRNDIAEKCFEVVGDSEGGYDTIETARIAKKSCEALYPSIDKFIIIPFVE